MNCFSHLSIIPIAKLSLRYSNSFLSYTNLNQK